MNPVNLTKMTQHKLVAENQQQRQNFIQIVCTDRQTTGILDFTTDVLVNVFPRYTCLSSSTIICYNNNYIVFSYIHTNSHDTQWKQNKDYN